MIWLALLALAVACATLKPFADNYALFQRAPHLSDEEQLPSVEVPSVSVLIPARNEAAGIERTIEQVLASERVDLELVILDDASTDRTREIVREFADRDGRVRLVCGQPLAEGWCGKQFACHQLAAAAKHDELVFLDADVRIEPDAILRAVAMRRDLDVALLSGFPHQTTCSVSEQLLIPLIQYILLCFLPFRMMRESTKESTSAGCGQFFLTTRGAYLTSGGHAAIRASLHDGLMLPRRYRRAGLSTDVFDADDIATVRMYHGLVETWNGLSKNAVEGIANARLIVPVTLLLLAANVLPIATLAVGIATQSHWVTAMSLLALLASYTPRVTVARRFDRAWLGAALHPLSILVFLAIQWTAWMKSWFGVSGSWRGRTYGTQVVSNTQ